MNSVKLKLAVLWICAVISTPALAVCELLDAFPREKAICKEYQELKLAYLAQGAEIEDVVFHKSRRFIDGDNYQKSNVLPWKAYRPAPMVWAFWERGNRIVKGLDLERRDYHSQGKPWGLTVETLKKIHRSTFRTEMVGELEKHLYRAGVKAGATPSIGQLRNEGNTYRPGFSLTPTPAEKATLLEIKDSKGASFLQLTTDGKVYYLEGSRVQAELENFLQEYNAGINGYQNQTMKESPVEFGARMQKKYVAIHPFHENQGRMSRWLLDLLFLSLDLPFLEGGRLQDDMTTDLKTYIDSMYVILEATNSDFKQCKTPFIHSSLLETVDGYFPAYSFCLLLPRFVPDPKKADELVELLTEPEHGEIATILQLSRLNTPESVMKSEINLLRRARAMGNVDLINGVLYNLQQEFDDLFEVSDPAIAEKLKPLLLAALPKLPDFWKDMILNNAFFSTDDAFADLALQLMNRSKNEKDELVRERLKLLREEEGACHIL